MKNNLNYIFYLLNFTPNNQIKIRYLVYDSLQCNKLKQLIKWKIVSNRQKSYLKNSSSLIIRKSFQMKNLTLRLLCQDRLKVCMQTKQRSQIKKYNSLFQMIYRNSIQIRITKKCLSKTMLFKQKWKISNKIIKKKNFFIKDKYTCQREKIKILGYKLKNCRSNYLIQRMKFLRCLKKQLKRGMVSYWHVIKRQQIGLIYQKKNYLNKRHIQINQNSKPAMNYPDKHLTMKFQFNNIKLSKGKIKIQLGLNPTQKAITNFQLRKQIKKIPI
ncbi:hypothetical protein TTHERM_000420399 (macronuclear) [Tetrahymena thermophila SB210]|uniref:Uncharacterized protein n=1 Tax=Tetrahymena thermophila (strain SB210) TaxID=312017 RepID=W7X0J4_TETTS|nr:hypothetical protein TTHERM_000420399 [Tetrahymena thermophila SB210]EWS72650.1 hypothetical protein TTHERM_000420399 [Tetrahymena thermophila SB210]|eukprot:XP_012654818.1 hypothetical protein TTHERM_000420399 [Tetrahymena thermophila SB210]